MQLTAGEEEEEAPYVERQTAQAEENRCQVDTNLNFYRGAKKQATRQLGSYRQWHNIHANIFFVTMYASQT